MKVAAVILAATMAFIFGTEGLRAAVGIAALAVVGGCLIEFALTRDYPGIKK